MRIVVAIVTCFWLITSCVQQEKSGNLKADQKSDVSHDFPAVAQSEEYALVIHGGAGSIQSGSIPTEVENEVRDVLDDVLHHGDSLLQAGLDAIEIVESVIVQLENSPFFNAGHGAVYTSNGTHELDASIMDGRDLNAGAVGGVTTVKNPIRAAKAVLDHSPHVLLTGSGADEFARLQNLMQVENTYFDTDRRRESLERAKKSELKDEKHGTVGCVVRDKKGNIAAGTSTGGMTNKKFNRLGDSPIIGAGTYADNRSCGVSATGHGEYFMRHAVAHDISSLIRYKDWTGAQAAHHVIHEVLNENAGAGGVIVIDNKGRISMPFNTLGMYRGYVIPGERKVLLFKNEK